MKKYKSIFLTLLLLFSITACEKKDSNSSVACTVDSQCWCAPFTGAEFKPGKSPSKCCDTDKQSDDPKNLDDGAWDCKKIGFCAECRYK